MEAALACVLDTKLFLCIGACVGLVGGRLLFWDPTSSRRCLRLPRGCCSKTGLLCLKLRQHPFAQVVDCVHGDALYPIFVALVVVGCSRCSKLV